MQTFLAILPYIGIVIGAIVLTLFIRWILSLRRVVKPSEVHVVRRSKVTDIYGNIKRLENDVTPDDTAGNVYYHIPIWVPIWGVEVQTLPLHNFSVDLSGYDAYDKDKLPFVVDVTAFFRIADYRQAASRIEDNNTLEEHLMKIVQSAVRSILAKDTLDQIMIQRSIYGEQFTQEVEDNLKEWGVVPVKSIELTDVRDKGGEEVISNIMQKKKSYIEMEARKEVALNNQKAKEAEIKAEQEVEMLDEAKKEAVGKRQAEREQSVGIAQEQSKQQVQEQAKITKEKEMEVIKVGTVEQANIDKQQTEINAEANRLKRSIDAKANVEVAEQGKIAATHEAEAGFIKKSKEAEAKLVEATNEAEGIKAKGEAEALAKEKTGLAEVAPQITLAKEIGENEGYQTYLIKIEQVKASKEVGVEQAKNLGSAQIKIIANAGSNIPDGVSSVMDLFTAKGGQALGSMVEAFAGTETGQQILSKIIKPENH